MELLALMIAGLVKALTVVIAGVVVAIVGLTSVIADLVTAIASSLLMAESEKRSRNKHEPDDGPRGRNRVRAFLANLSRKRWFRYGLRTAIALSVVLFLGLIWLGTAGFPYVARWGLGIVEERAHVEVTIEKISGNLFTGQIRLRKISWLSTPENPRYVSGTCESIDARLRIGSIFRRAPIVEQLVLRDADLRFRDPRPRTEEPAPPEPPRPLPSFIVRNLDIENLTIDYQRADAEPVLGAIHNWRADQVRSQWFVLDLLLRSHLQAEANGATIHVAGHESENGHHTEWTFAGVPVTLAAQPIRPLRMMRAGTVDARVVNLWSLSPGADTIALDWEVSFNNIEAAPPADAHPFTLPLYTAASQFFNARETRTLRFSMEMRADQFDGAISLDGTELWTVLSDALMNAIAEHLGVPREAQSDLLDLAGEAASRLRDHWRRPPQD